MPNRLSNELSPYLLQHAENPVDWFPWCEEALQKSADEDKPIFLSIGYSACHWCHVMEHESFESPDIAAILNANFVSIKVDREERPDLDQIYMNAVMALRRGGGGWPLSVFLTPSREVFFGGTYWPPESRMGMPGFDHVLARVLDAYHKNREQVDLQSGQITQWLADDRSEQAAPFDEGLLMSAASSLRDSFDFQHGGFGTAPKFPHSMDLALLLRLWRRWNGTDAEIDTDELMEMVQVNLRKMAYGGIFDHLAGGFARYSVDERWLVPHFEKMLYDNGLLATAYYETYRATGDEFFAMIGRKTLDYLIQYMTSDEGAYFSTEDADSEGEEGKFYVWSRAEILDILGTETGERFCLLYNVTDAGNFEGHNILNMTASYGDVADRLGVTKSELRAEMKDARAKLLTVRDQRIRPGLDDKVLCCWNALGITAMCEGYLAKGDERHLNSAEKAFEYIWTKLRDDDGNLMRLSRNGTVRQTAFLDDYSYLLNAIDSLYRATLDEKYVDFAAELIEQMIEKFADEKGGGFFFTANDAEKLIARSKDSQDSSVPSGNSMAATALISWGRLCGRTDWIERAESIVGLNVPLMQRAPMACGQMLVAAEALLTTGRELVLVLANEEQRQEFTKLLHENWRPNVSQIVRVAGQETVSELLNSVCNGKTIVDGQVTLYICENFSCQKPIVGESEVTQAIKNL